MIRKYWKAQKESYRYDFLDSLNAGNYASFVCLFFTLFCSFGLIAFLYGYYYFLIFIGIAFGTLSLIGLNVLIYKLAKGYFLSKKPQLYFGGDFSRKK